MKALLIIILILVNLTCSQNTRYEKWQTSFLKGFKNRHSYEFDTDRSYMIISSFSKGTILIEMSGFNNEVTVLFDSLSATSNSMGLNSSYPIERNIEINKNVKKDIQMNMILLKKLYDLKNIRNVSDLFMIMKTNAHEQIFINIEGERKSIVVMEAIIKNLLPFTHGIVKYQLSSHLSP